MTIDKWSSVLVKIHLNEQKINIPFTFWLPLEFFIRRVKYQFFFQVLGTVSSRCAKKTVVRMTELVATFFAVYCSLSFLADVYGLFKDFRLEVETSRYINVLVVLDEF